MDGMEYILSDYTVEDVSWLCSLSESELDFLISIKLLVLQRAKMVGRGELAMKFDLKMLRALGLILMEHLKGKLEDLSLVPDLPQPSLFMDGCNLLKSKLEGIMSMEELKACIIDDSQKKWAKRPREESVIG
ncbi:hypothetical protein HS088_TW14G00373 [Tripterygium wilfordii]|uniref:Spc97 / Spc98 family of spindle pole body (SBP) component n=1 Tax=Tripterygium wilfordii TaxID=458696 RepID=A0A7J7CQ69_TRIWF|nr:uncharacterized protein LOC120014653 [Tripterygium wilfordii]XP_038722593.1 uncharacterized protein LOC120014653 [Tripterygium wilfordii]KAF5736237.1 hypothetical protein HS088_TW14G00373 [Tripterygium wilfordii]